MAKYKAYSTKKKKKKENTLTLERAKLSLYFLQASQFLKKTSPHLAMLPVCARKAPAGYENLTKIFRSNP